MLLSLLILRFHPTNQKFLRGYFAMLCAVFCNSANVFLNLFCLPLFFGIEAQAQRELTYQSIGITHANKDIHATASLDTSNLPSQVGSSGMMMMGPPPPLGGLSTGGMTSDFHGSIEQQHLVAHEMGTLQQQLTALQNQANLMGVVHPSQSVDGRSIGPIERGNTNDSGFLQNPDDDTFFAGCGAPQNHHQQQQQQQMLTFQAQQLLHHAASTNSAQAAISMISQGFNFQPSFFPSHLPGSNNILNSPSFMLHGNTIINPNAFGSASFQDEKAFSPFDAVGSTSTNLEPNAFPERYNSTGWDTGLPCRKPMTLFMPCDDESLSEYQCLVRQQIEIFEAGVAEVESNAKGRNKPIVLGQVGIRCRHCSKVAPKQRTKGAMYYPAKLNGLYQAAQSLASGHLCVHCKDIPPGIRQELIVLKEKKSSAGGGKDYWGEGVRILGVYEDEDGLRFKNGKS